MAHVVIYSMAYRGDVFPYAPIAAELARRNHRVTFLAPAELLPSLTADGVTLVDAEAGEMCPSRPDHYGQYCARWGKVVSGALLMPLLSSCPIGTTCGFRVSALNIAGYSSASNALFVGP